MCKIVCRSGYSSEEASDASARKPKHCKAVGCTVDLRILDQPYLYKRGLCRAHIQADSIELKGQAEGSLWRFCQQCNKIEPLSLFQGKKRSCHVALQKRRENDRKPKQRPLYKSVFEAVQQAQEAAAQEAAAQEVAAAAAMTMALPEYNQALTYSPDSSSFTFQPVGLHCPAPGALCPTLPVAMSPAVAPAASASLAVHQRATATTTEQNLAGSTACELLDLSAMLDDSLFDGELEQLVEQKLQAVGGALLPEPTAAAAYVPAASASADQKLQEIELRLLADIEAATRLAASTWHPGPAAAVQPGMLLHPSGQLSNSSSVQHVAAGATGTSTTPTGAAAKVALLGELQQLSKEFASLNQQLQLGPVCSCSSRVSAGFPCGAQQLFSTSSMGAYNM